MDPQIISAWRSENEISITSQNQPRPILHFEHAWSQDIVSALHSRDIKKPLPIQSQTWPILLQGENLIGVAQTGSGKTLGFLLPLLQHVAAQQPRNAHALILAPTRELATQIHQETVYFKRFFGRLNSALCYGGAPRRAQHQNLLQKPEIIVGTPGRLLDFVSSGVLNLNSVSTVVLDEADRLLDMGFEKNVRDILDQIRPQRQITLFTATWPKKVENLSRDFIWNPIKVRIGSQTDELVAAKTINQMIHACQNYEKIDLLGQILEQLEEYSAEQKIPFKIMIFANTKATVDLIEDHMRSNFPRYGSEGFHGDKSQDTRERTLDRFRNHKTGILIASDAAARGLDVKDVTCVVNYDLPRDIESYVHRIGRTGRAGRLGTAVSFYTPQDFPLRDDLIAVLRKSGQEIPDSLRRR